MYLKGVAMTRRLPGYLCLTAGRAVVKKFGREMIDNR